MPRLQNLRLARGEGRRGMEKRSLPDFVTLAIEFSLRSEIHFSRLM
jgi:hypothetical protein